MIRPGCRCAGWPGLRRRHPFEEVVDRALQRRGLPSSAPVALSTCDADWLVSSIASVDGRHVAGKLVRAVRGLMHVAADLLRRGALLLDRRRDSRT